ncbi:MAG: divalent-cation tolerance protein CutA [Candidatus Riflebacteria bacterium]|nr:divalent-cation tolerance protein CutA [Candidatus Riflebacteria bacterium]
MQKKANKKTRIVFVTVPPGIAFDLLSKLVEERLVAGGNIISGVQSVYRWKNEIRNDPESILLMETSEECVEAMMARIKELHPYEVPKILTFSPVEGPADYLRWVDDETKRHL